MSDLTGFLTLAKQTVADLIARRRAKIENSWDDVVATLDTLSELSNHHVKAIAEVTAPLVVEQNLLETSRRYAVLVNNPDFPQGYDEVRGILAAMRSLSTFEAATIQERIRTVIDRLTEFQYGVFTISWDSYRVCDAVAEAAKAITDPAPSAELIQQISQPFFTTFTGLFEETTPPFNGVPATKEALVGFLQRWFQSWQRHVQRTLYGGKGLNSAIAELKMQRHV